MFEGIVAGNHIEGWTESDGTLDTAVVIVVKVLGEDDPTEGSKLAIWALQAQYGDRDHECT